MINRILGKLFPPDLSSFISFHYEDSLPPLELPKDLLIVGIGYPDISGDSIGPRVGSILQNLGYEVIGTIGDPLIGDKLDYYTRLLRKEKRPVLAIDACVYYEDHEGFIDFDHIPIYPGRGLKKRKPPIGTMSIRACTAKSSKCIDTTMKNLASVDPRLVINMSYTIAKWILNSSFNRQKIA